MRLDSCPLAVCEPLISCACSAAKGTLGGMFGVLKGLVGSKSLSREDMESVLDKMRDHLIGKSEEQLGLCLWAGMVEGRTI